MDIEIRCPSCDKRSVTDWERVPKGKIKTTCNVCAHQFVLDKVAGHNCQAKLAAADVEPTFAGSGWTVEHPACGGMLYDLEDVIGLIRSGMIGGDTRVLPPGERGYRKASMVPPLQKAVEQWEAKNARSTRG